MFLQMRAVGTPTCSRSEGSDLKDACQTSCESACSQVTEKYTARAVEVTGISVDEREKQRVAKGCTRACRKECGKPGKVFDFSMTSRR